MHHAAISQCSLFSVPIYPCSIVDVIPDGIDLSQVFIGDNHIDVKEEVNSVYQYRWVRYLDAESIYFRSRPSI